jgi:hypothetical protein
MLSSYSPTVDDHIKNKSDACRRLGGTTMYAVFVGEHLVLLDQKKPILEADPRLD